MRLQSQVAGVIVWGVLCIATPVPGGTPDPQSMKYFQLLLRQGDSEVVYDRFYDAWLDHGTLETLETFLKDHLAEQPGAEARLLLAKFYERQNWDDQALTLYAEATLDRPQDAGILFLKAKTEARLLSDDQAIEDLKTAQTLDMEDDLRMEIGKTLGRLYVRTGYHDLARETWEQLLTAFPSDEDLYEDLIELQLTEGVYDQALVTCDALLAKSSDAYDRVMRRLRKGDIYLYSAKDDDALKIYAETLGMVGQGTWLETQICFQIDQVFRRQDDLEGLRDFMAELSAADPQRLALKKKLAGLHLALGDTEEALTLHRDILKVTPGDTDNQSAYVDALVKSNRLAEAVTLMEQLVVQRPLERDLLIQLADLHHQNKQPDQVSDCLRRFLSLTENPTEFAYLRIARLLERYSLGEEALTVYQEMIDQFPESLSAKEAYAVVLHRHDRTDEALTLWSEIVKIGDLPTLMRVTQMAGSYGHQAQAYRWFVSQYDVNKDNLSYLNRLCDIAIRQKDYARALKWGRSQLELSESFQQTQNAIQQILTVTQQLQNQEEVMARLEGQVNRSVAQTCLWVELLERAQESDRADLVLAQASQEDLRIALQTIRLYRHRRQWDLAAKHLERLVTDGGRNSLHIRDLIQLYNRSGQYDKAMSWIPAWKKASPGNVAPWLEQARLLVLLGRYTEAINALRKADQTFDGEPRVLTQLASEYRRAQRTGDAQRVYWRLFEQAKDLTDKIRWVRDMGYASSQMGERTKLIEKFLTRKRTNPNSVIPNLALAELYRQADQYEKRRQALIEATRIRSDDVSLLHEIARIEESEGDWKRALDTLAMAAGLDKTQKSRQKMAQLHLQYGNEEDGYRILFDLAGARTMSPNEVLTTAETIMVGQNWAMAVEFLEDVIAQHPENYKLQYLYAVALEEDGQELKAVEQFVNLLSFRRELPGNTAQSRLQAWAGASGIDQILSEESIALMQYQQFLSMAYEYRRQQGRISYRYSGAAYGPTGPRFPAPETVLDAPQFAWAHLLTLADVLGDESQNRVQRLMDSSGVSNHGVLSYVTALPLGNFYSALPEMVELFPDNPAVLELAAFYSVQRHFMEPDQVRRLFARFKETRPNLGALMGLAYAIGNEDLQDLIEPSLGILALVEQPSGYEFSLLCNLFQNPEASVPKAHVAALSDLIRSWYPLMVKTPSRYQALAAQAALVLGSIGDVHGCLTLMDQEILRAAKGPQITSPFAHAYPGAGSFIQRSSSTLIQPLEYPGRAIPGVPVTIVQALLPMRSGYISGGRLTLDPNHLEGYIEVVQDPMLKVLICLNVQNQDRARALLDAMVAEDSAPVAACYLLALLESQRDDTGRVVPLLARVRDEIKDAQDREALDGSIVFYAQAMEPNESAEIVTLAQDAAKRLTRRPLNDRKKRELVRVMEQIGLEKEAERLSRVAVNQRPAQPQYFQTAQQGTSSSSLSRIEGLFEKGKSRAALQLAYRSLRADASNSLTPDQARDRSRTTQLMELLRGQKTHDRILEMAHPGQSGNLRRWLEYGRLCQILKEPDKAKEAYATILVKRPRDFTARIWSVLLHAAGDPNQAVAHLQRVDSRYVDQMADQLSSYVQNNYHRDGGLDLMLNMGRVAVTYLDGLDDPNQQDVRWIGSLVQRLSQPYHRNGLELDSIYRPPVSSKSTMPGGAAMVGRGGGIVMAAPRVGGARSSDTQTRRSLSELDQMRREVHNQLCRHMVKIPQVSAQGFSGLLAEAMSRDDVTPEFESLAHRALLNAPSRKLQMRMQFSRVSYSGHYSWGSDFDSRYISPTEYLVRTFWKQEQLAVQADALHVKLEQRGLHEQASQLKRLADLYLCDAQQFATQAKAFLSNRSASLPSHTSLLLVIDIWRQRGQNIDLNDLVLAQLKGSFESNHYSVQGRIDAYVRELIKRSPDQAHVFLDRMMTLYLGPKEKRQAFIDTHYDARQVSSRTLNSRIHACFQMLGQMSRQEGLLFAILAQVQGIEVPGSSLDLHYRVRQAVQEKINRAMQTKDALELMTFIHGAPFLEDPNTFRPLTVPRLERHTVFSSLMYELRQAMARESRQAPQDNTLSESLKESLLTEQASFGRDMLLAFLEKDDVYQAVYHCIANHLDVILTLPERRQREISLLVVDILGTDVPELQAWPEAAQSAYAWASKIRSESGQDRVAQFLKVRRFEDLNIDGYQFQGYVANHLKAVIATNPESAKEILVKAQSLEAMARKRGTWRYSSHESLTTGILRQLTQNSNQPDLNVLGLILHLVRDQDQAHVIVSPSTLRDIGSQLRQLYRQRSREADSDPLAGFKTLYVSLRRVAGSGNVSGLSGTFYQLLDQGSRQDIDVLLAWLESEADTDPCPGLNAEFQMLLRDRKTRYSGRPRNADPEENPDHDIGRFYLKVLDNNDLSVQWRLLAYLGVADSGLSKKESVTLAAARRLSTAWSIYPDLTTEFASSILSKLVAIEDRSQGWTEAATRLCQSYAVMRQKQAKMANASSQYRHTNDIQLRIMELNLMLGQEDAVSQMLRGYDAALGRYEDAWGMAVNYDQGALFNMMVTKNWKQKSQAGQLRNAPELMTHLESCLESIAPPDLRYYAEAVIKSLYHTRISRQGRGRRNDAGNPMIDLARRFKDVSFASSELRQKTLLELIETPEATVVIEEYLAEEAETLDWGLLVSQRSRSGSRVEASILTAYGQRRLLEGDPNTFVQGMKAIMESTPSSRPYEGSQLIGEVWRSVYDLIRGTGSEWFLLDGEGTDVKMARIKALAEVSAAVLQYGDIRFGNVDYRRLVPYHIICRVLSGQQERLKEDMAGLADEFTQRYLVGMDLSTVQRALQSFVSLRLPFKDRLDIYRRLMQVDWVKATLDRRPGVNRSSQWISYRLLTEEEVKNNQAALKSLGIDVEDGSRGRPSPRGRRVGLRSGVGR